MLHPTDADREKGIWEYNEEADGHRWHYIIVNEVTYALPCYLDWVEEMEEWCQVTMGQWPFGTLMYMLINIVWMYEKDNNLFLCHNTTLISLLTE